jgi:SAM-dependent methyltransferase
VTAGAPRPALPLPTAAALVVLASAAVLALEIVVQRLVVPYVGLTLDTSTAAIGVALAGIAAGTFLGGRAADRVDPRLTLGPCFVGAGLLVLLARPLALLLGPVVQGTGPAGAVVLTAAAVAAPITVLAAVPPAVIKTRLRDLGETGAEVGRIDALSTLGALAGTFVTGYVLLGQLSTRTILGVTGVALVVVGLLLTGMRRRLGAVEPEPPGAARLLTPVPVVLLAVVAISALVGVSGPCEYETRYYCARVETVEGAPTQRLLLLDDLRHAQVDLADPTALQFAYTQRFGDVLDTVGAPGEPLDVLHLGGGGFTMPRWLAATRPGSRSTVLEIDPAIVRLNREELGLDAVPGVTARTGDARARLAEQPADAYDAVVGDAFGSLTVPWHLATQEFVRDVERVLRPGGVYVLNVIDNPPLDFVRAEAATLATVFDEVAVLARPGQLTGSSGGNYVLVASDAPLDLDRFQADAEARGEPGGVAGEEFARGGRVLTDDDAPVDQLITPLYAVRRA